MDEYNLIGRIRPVYKGAWNSETEYTTLEVVTSDDAHIAYVAIKDVPAGISLDNKEYWGVMIDVRELSAVEEQARRSAVLANEAADAANSKIAEAETAATQAFDAANQAMLASTNANTYANVARQAGAAANLASMRADDAAANANAIADKAKNTPYIGANNNWFIWDSAANEYVDSGKIAMGAPGGFYEPSVTETGSYIDFRFAPSDPSMGDEIIAFLIPKSKGAPGKDGKDGGYCAPILSKDGMLGWEYRELSQGIQLPVAVNIKGEKGDPGEVSKAELDIKADALVEVAEGKHVSFYPEETNIPKAIVSMDPIQPGKGNPHVGGCGKNLIPFPYMDNSKTVHGVVFTNNGDGSITINGTSTHDSASDFNLGVVPTNNDSAWYGNIHGSTKEEYVFGLWDSNGNPVTHNGINIRILSNLDGGTNTMQIRVLKGIAVNNVTIWPMLERGSVPTAWEPYENIRPISSRTSVTLTRTGKNVCPGFENGKAYANDTGADYPSDANSTIPQYARTKKIPIKPGATYTQSNNLNLNITSIHFWDASDTWVGWLSTSNINARIEGVDAAYMGFVYYRNSGVSLEWVQVEEGSVATEYESYLGESSTINFEDPIYGGTLDLATGELKIDREKLLLDGSTAWTQYQASNNLAYIDIATMKLDSKLICNNFSQSYSFVENVPGLLSNPTRNRLVVTRADLLGATDKNSLNAWFAAHPTEVIYELVEPIIVQLPLVQMEALLGINYMHTDGSKLAVTYNKSLSRAFDEIKGEKHNAGGAGIVFATLTQFGTTYSCDMSYDKILSELNTGKLVRLKWQTNSDVIRNYDYVGIFGMTTEPYIVFQYQSQTGYGTVFVYKNGEVKHYNGTLVRNNLTINGKALTDNVTLTATDVSAIANETGAIKTNHYGDMSITSVKLADYVVWPRHVSDLVWDEVDSRINTALGVIENGTY